MKKAPRGWLAALLLLSTGASAQAPGWTAYGALPGGRQDYRLLSSGTGGAVDVLVRLACRLEPKAEGMAECVYVRESARRLVLDLLRAGPKKKDYAVENPAYPDHPKGHLLAVREEIAYAIDCPGKRQRVLRREWFNVRGELLTRLRFLKESWNGLGAIQELAAKVCAP